MIGAKRLALCSGTLLHASSLQEKLEAASGAGFGGVSLWYEDYRAARAEGLGDADIQAMLSANGLQVNETDSLARWLPGADPQRTDNPIMRDMLSLDERTVFEAAVAMGAGSVMAVELLGDPVDVDVATEAFAGLCDRAAKYDLTVNLEFMPFSGIPDLATAIAIVEGADRVNGGINVDAWHLFRSDSPLDLLAELPGARVTLVQLSDAPAEVPTDIAAETGSGRLLPGQGDMDLVGLLRTLDQIGTRAPIGVEVFSDQLRMLQPREVAQRSMDAARALLERAAALP